MISVAQFQELATEFMENEADRNQGDLDAMAGLEPDALHCLYEQNLSTMLVAAQGRIDALVWIAFAGAFYLGVHVGRTVDP